MGLITLDILFTYQASLPSGHNTVKESIYAEPFSQQIISTWIQGLLVVLSMNIPYWLGAATSTILGIYKPADWAPMFGNPKDAYSLNRFWNLTWHQGMRFQLSLPAKWFTSNVIGLHGGSVMSRYIQVFIAFLLSGLIHSYGSFAAFHKDVGDFQFFLVQGLGFLAEETVIHIAKKIGLLETPLTRAIGYLWVWAWLTYTARPWMDGFQANGLWIISNQYPSVSRLVIGAISSKFI
jgi:hypothetical protein